MHGGPPGFSSAGGYGQNPSHTQSGMYGHGGGHGQYGHGEKDKDKGSAMKYGLGGAAVGALAGGAIAHGMGDDSDEEGHHAAQSGGYAGAPPASDPQNDMPVSDLLIMREHQTD